MGNVWCALISWLYAKQAGGTWMLRIEDIDRQRSKQHWADLIMDDLEWLGLTWDEGPIYQSSRDEIYNHYFSQLDTYPCFCTRADLLASSAPHDSDGHRVYSGHCRKLTQAQQQEMQSGRTPAWRLRIPHRTIGFNDLFCGHYEADIAQEWGDIILRRADGAFAYQLAVTVDDALMGVTQVIRGRDLLTSTLPQLYLYDTLSLPAPEFGHIPLLVNADGQRLSKRDKSLDMEALRATHTPEQLLGRLAHQASLTPTPTPISLPELLETHLTIK